MTGIEFAEVEPFVGGGMRDPKQNLLNEMERAGVTPSYVPPVLLHLSDRLFLLIANHEYGVSATDASAVTVATLRARKEVHSIVDALRRLGGAWADLEIVATAEQIGVREGRRIHGRYTVTLDDMIDGREHADAVCRATFGIDIHATDPAQTRGFDVPRREGVRVKTKPYDIPVRALIARDVNNLLLAGRCISGDFFAHSSYRVTGNAVAMGEAAGKLAAAAALRGMTPHEVALRTSEHSA